MRPRLSVGHAPDRALAYPILHRYACLWFAAGKKRLDYRDVSFAEFRVVVAIAANHRSVAVQNITTVGGVVLVRAPLKILRSVVVLVAVDVVTAEAIWTLAQKGQKNEMMNKPRAAVDADAEIAVLVVGA